MKKMRIGIDISQIVFQGTGVATYTQKLIENLLKIDRKNEYFLFGSSLRQRKRLENFVSQHNGTLYEPQAKSNSGVYYTKAVDKIYSFPPIFLEALWNKLHILPIEKLIGKVDVFHSSDWLQPPSQARKVTTVHDLIVYRYPESFVKRGGHDVIVNQKRRLAWVKKECDLIIADSKATKNDIVEILGIPEKKIRLVYLAANERFKPQSKKEVDRIKRKYKMRGDYILSVGTREPRKNLKRTIQAFISLTRSDLVQGPTLKLAVAGGFGWGEDILASNIKHQTSNITLLGFIPQEDLPALYSGASCFVYPSLYEGFGLPVLEALSCGCPVITSNVSSLPEVVGNAAVLVNPENTEEIADGIKKAIKNRDVLVKKGLAQAKKFNWTKTARETLEVYKEAVRC